MESRFKTYAYRTIGVVAALAMGLIAGSPAVADDSMPVEQQNALVKKKPSQLEDFLTTVGRAIKEMLSA